MKAKIISALIGVVFFASCKKDSNTTYTPTCDGTTKSWVTDVKPIMDGYCANCHSSFSIYSSVSNSLSSIRSKIVDGTMPKSFSLTTAQKDKVVCWIDNGAPNN